MANGIDVTIDRGRALVSAETPEGRRKALSALLRADQTGVKTRTDGRQPYWEVSEQAARDAGLVDAPKPARKPSAKRRTAEQEAPPDDSADDALADPHNGGQDVS